jgi:hypothetical protein
MPERYGFCSESLLSTLDDAEVYLRIRICEGFATCAAVTRGIVECRFASNKHAAKPKGTLIHMTPVCATAERKGIPTGTITSYKMTPPSASYLLRYHPLLGESSLIVAGRLTLDTRGAVFCASCQKKLGVKNPGKKCGRCRAVFYCDQDCQERSWKWGKHKEDCKFIREKGVTAPFDSGPATGNMWASIFKAVISAPHLFYHDIFADTDIERH